MDAPALYLVGRKWNDGVMSVVAAVHEEVHQGLVILLHRRNGVRQVELSECGQHADTRRLA